ncbi:hypothetical protein A1O1_06352 [Capronia coronata CBS 617.96]|uniref:Microbial-type PARG catalytic domain-containing protein n=1 Tax=Capronia coronata CBS 617.96 TaxID=1182541 RepID=W9Y0I6_9EURO|nr:uncharacterized protein A1O1_06352 [Capronia coronata CBS 617.96]EXJ85983.1 hypothetical protein A1O1_06352 [Capronia coronata CBS 617.96]
MAHNRNKRGSDHDDDDDYKPSPPKRRRSQRVLTRTPSGQLISKPPASGPPKPFDRDQLAYTARETIRLLPGLLITRPDAKPDGFLCQKHQVGPLDQTFCPRLPKTKVRVINSDTIEAALQISRRSSDKPICVLNMANAIHAGGGFRKGALAQEEALCYRTSLSYSLKIRHYPIPDKAAIYSPTILVIRDSLANGHGVLDARDPSRLPVISVVSAAAIHKPKTKVLANANLPPAMSAVYTSAGDRELMREKMRIVLRTAIRNRHRKIVLGAFGCGAFANPLKEVGDLWVSVLKDFEFAGGWWEEVIFAVLSSPKDPNFDWYHKVLHGLEV